jgi:hypothetical protein
MAPVPNFPKIYNDFLKQGLRPHQASIKAHAIIRAHVESEKAENSESDEEEDDETDSRRVISKELEKMKLTAAKLSNHYKQDKKLLLLIKYITNILRKY